MACTTILAGKGATYDGSTMIARNDDSPSGQYTPKKYIVVTPDMQPKTYKSVLSHVEIKLPKNPMKYTAMPNAVNGEGIWAACGVNEKNVAMSATETITSNERVIGADPLVEYVPASDDEQDVYKIALGDKKDSGTAEKPGGIGEEDLVVLTLPYISSAREGVIRMGKLLEEYGTYEENGMAFSDTDEIWWLESIGGHHWIARRVPDDTYVVMPNQQGIDYFDFDDAFGAKKDYLCSSDMREFIAENHLDLSQDGAEFDVRAAFGSHEDADHVYNTPRAWYMLRYFNPSDFVWDGPEAEYSPESDDLPWCMVPEKKITPEDIKYILSSHFQGTPYDPYLTYGDKSVSGAYRSIGINRNDFMGFVQIRPFMAESCRAIQWIAFSSNAFNVMIPQFAQVNTTPEYLSNTDSNVSTDNFYWTSRLISAITDASYKGCINHIERYQIAVQSKSNEIINKYNKMFSEDFSLATSQAMEEANNEIADMVRKEAEKTLNSVLFTRSNDMKNSYARSDA